MTTLSFFGKATLSFLGVNIQGVIGFYGVQMTIPLAK